MSQVSTAEQQSTSLRTPKVKSEALAGRVYEVIKEAILDLQMAPGARLNMEQLAKDVGVSISPIREALIRLAAERLVVFKPFSGYAVADLPDKKAFLDLIEARLVLESYAARLGAPRRDPAVLEAMQQSLEELGRLSGGRKYQEYRSVIVWDVQLHTALMNSAGNSTLSQIYEDLHPHTQISRLYIHMQHEINPAMLVDHHLPIVQAYEQGNAEAAVEAVHLHMQKTCAWIDTLNMA